MKLRDDKLKDIVDWSEKNRAIRAVLLTSSLVNPLAPVDELSDLDIELVFENNSDYIADKSWICNFGSPIAIIGEDESSFENKHAITMVLYEDGIKVDFKLYSKSNFIAETQLSKLPKDWDIGYEVLIDKDKLTESMHKPSFEASIIKKPSKQEFEQLIYDFWWDITYVAKSLVRDEIFYAKFMSETIIRTEYLTPLIEWYIASAHNWSITTNKQGRLFKKYLDSDIWLKIEQTFSGSNLTDNWNALSAMTNLVSEIGCELSTRLGYSYPQKLEENILLYIKKLKP